ncbi:MAG: MerR family transcriptional regulator [Epulopiscium sp.]|nr:MerR family transcriptional regulator [Candidatus Epulonipiscium sp.]
MKIVNCERCGKLFEYNGISNYCPICMQYDEANFQKIKEYLGEHPKATVIQVATDLDIPLKMIKKYLREGRLEIVEAENFFLECEKCGAPIKTGRFCEQCTRDLDSNVKRIINEAKSNLKNTRSDEKMRYLDKDKIKIK